MKVKKQAMKEKDKIIYYNGVKYIIIKSAIYLGNKYIFIINYDNPNDTKILVCLNELKEVDDIHLLKNILLEMN